MKQQASSLIYTILADDKPVAALESSAPEARELLKESWSLKNCLRSKLTVNRSTNPGPGYEPGRPPKKSGLYTIKSARHRKMRMRSCSFTSSTWIRRQEKAAADWGSDGLLRLLSRNLVVSRPTTVAYLDLCSLEDGQFPPALLRSGSLIPNG
jgi:hypothetical protein